MDRYRDKRESIFRFIFVLSTTLCEEQKSLKITYDVFIDYFARRKIQKKKKNSKGENEIGKLKSK